MVLQGESNSQGISREEIVTIVDEQNRKIGAEPRYRMRELGLIHRATYILVFNSQKKIYVQKRTKTKDVFPGFYDVAPGGVVIAGETYHESAARELEEELGIKNVPLTHLFEFFYKDGKMKIWGSAYCCIYDGKIILQKEEVESGDFYKIDEALLMSEQQPFTPDGIYVLKRYLKNINEFTLKTTNCTNFNKIH